jgi:Tfp pilus assembly protein PilX
MECAQRRGDVTSDRGQALGLVLMSVALIAMVAVGITSIATRLTDRSRAQNAADAAALAGVSGGAAEASIVATRNGAVLVSFDDVTTELGVIVTVEVMVGDERAIARASSEP